MGSEMGGMCGSDIFLLLKKKYGPELIKLVIAESMKEKVRLRFQELQRQIEGMFKEGRGTVNDLGNEKVNLIAKFIEELRNQIDRLLPGGIREIEKQGGQSIEEISGVSQMKAAVSDVRRRALAQLEDSWKRTVGELKAKEKYFLNNLQKEIPKLEQYNQLKHKVRLQVLAKGEEAFSSQIESKEYHTRREIDNEVKLDSIRDTIHHIIPRKELNEATEMIPTDSENTAIANLSSLLKVDSEHHPHAEGIHRLIGLFEDEATLNYPLTDIDFQESKDTEFKTIPYIQTHVDLNFAGKSESLRPKSTKSFKSLNVVIEEQKTEAEAQVTVPAKKPYMSYFYM